MRIFMVIILIIGFAVAARADSIATDGAVTHEQTAREEPEVDAIPDAMTQTAEIIRMAEEVLTDAGLSAGDQPFARAPSVDVSSDTAEVPSRVHEKPDALRARIERLEKEMHKLQRLLGRRGEGR